MQLNGETVPAAIVKQPRDVFLPYEQLDGGHKFLVSPAAAAAAAAAAGVSKDAAEGRTRGAPLGAPPSPFPFVILFERDKMQSCVWLSSCCFRDKHVHEMHACMHV